jgi:hypothetical protein
MTCFDSWYLNQPAMATVEGNGTLHIFISNTCSGYTCTYYDDAQRGNFPWSPCTAGVPPSTVLPASLKTVSVTAKLLNRDLLLGSRYHIYLALYYYLPNGPVTVGGVSYQCFDTQVRVQNINGTDSPVGTSDTYDPGDSFGYDSVASTLDPGQTGVLTANVDSSFRVAALAWGIDPGTSRSLMGVEIGIEAYSVNLVTANFYDTQFT